MLGLQVSEQAAQHVKILHYAYPVALFLWFAGGQVVAACTLANLRTDLKPYRRTTAIWLQLAVIACYTAEAAILIARTLIRSNWWCGQHNVLYLITSIITWFILEIALLENPQPVWLTYYSCWGLAVVVELILVAARAAHLEANEPFDVARLWVQAVRLLVLVSLPALTVILKEPVTKTVGDVEERSALLGAGNNNQQTDNYGSIDSSEDDPYNDPEAKAKLFERMEKSGSWLAYAKSFKIFLPYVWPSKNRYVQACAVMVGICLLIERAVQVLVPYQMGVVVDSLTADSTHAPWKAVSLLILYRWLNSGSGLDWFRNYFWVIVDQFSYKAVTTAAYNHVMSLSYDFHSEKKSGEVMTIVSQGRSIGELVQSILFTFAPMVADMFIAFGYFLIFYNAYMALIVFGVCVLYLWATTRLASLKNRVRRDVNAAMRNESNVMMESMSSWTTVSYFNQIGYEQNRYMEAVDRYQVAEKDWVVGISTISVVQSLIFTVGLLMACFLAIYEISTGARPIGSFVTLLSYWSQLSSPLMVFSSLYRNVMNKLLDAEKLLSVFQRTSSIVDKPNALELTDVRGDIVFDNVCFHYDERKPVLRDISFHVAPGSTVALVGETGGGKTTCLRLLFRFYDVTSGSIKVDGHDVRDVTLKSLRDNMGVVPQDPQLFNDTIMNNLKYANLDATDEEVFAATRAASIHDKIMSFPDKYQSKVGERGVKLSGGELQRVAIARAILRDPKIILLDEATSMIDVDTERQIQAAFNALAKDRTMFIIAHRLSTIMNADLIIVVKDGAMVESGNHDELLSIPDGKYRQLWEKQGKHIQSASGQETSILDENIPETGLDKPMTPTKVQKKASTLSKDGKTASKEDSGVGVQIPSKILAEALSKLDTGKITSIASGRESNSNSTTVVQTSTQTSKCSSPTELDLDGPPPKISQGPEKTSDSVHRRSSLIPIKASSVERSIPQHNIPSKTSRDSLTAKSSGSKKNTGKTTPTPTPKPQESPKRDVVVKNVTNTTTTHAKPSSIPQTSAKPLEKNRTRSGTILKDENTVKNITTSTSSTGGV